VDAGTLARFEEASPGVLAELARLIERGVNHKQQHQEPMVTDLKYNLQITPLRPAYHDRTISRGGATAAIAWAEHVGGVVQSGWDGKACAFHHEFPRRNALLHPRRI
jgi:hypothetical protein